MKYAFCGFALLVATAAIPTLAGDWPAFRGADGSGHANEGNLPIEWGPGKNVKWRVELPGSPETGSGNSSPIVSNGRVFLAVAVNEGRQRSLHCYDRNDGKLLWAKTVDYGKTKQTHKTNPYAGATPVADGEKVIVWHGSAGVYCYDFAGEQLWSRDLGEVGHIWGYGSSPIIHQGKVVLNFGPGKESFVIALDLADGKTVWKTDESGGADDRSGRMIGSWSTPSVVNINGQEQLLCSMPTRVVAYEPATGDIIWTCGGLPSERGDLVYTSVLTAGGFGVAMGGYKGPSIGFRLGGSGDVTESNRLWRSERGQPQRIGSGVIVGGHVYIANAGPSTVECINVQTGEVLWEKRLPGNHWGSTIYADGRLYVTNQDGVTQVFAANPERFESLAANSFDEPSNSTPAFSNGQIFLRTFRALYCVGK